MDMLKSGIGLQAFAEKDPRVAYKREGYRFFREMMMAIRDKVTGIIFRVNAAGGAAPEPQSNYNATSETHAAADATYDVGDNARETATAVSGGERALEQADDETAAGPATIVRNQPKVGRNDPCPCGSGEKYKRCHGKTASA